MIVTTKSNLNYFCRSIVGAMLRFVQLKRLQMEASHGRYVKIHAIQKESRQA